MLPVPAEHSEEVAVWRLAGTFVEDAGEILALTGSVLLRSWCLGGDLTARELVKQVDLTFS